MSALVPASDSSRPNDRRSLHHDKAGALQMGTRRFATIFASISSASFFRLRPSNSRAKASAFAKSSREAGVRRSVGSVMSALPDLPARERSCGRIARRELARRTSNGPLRTQNPTGLDAISGHGRPSPMDALTLLGLFAVTAMLICYALEDRSPWFILAFAGACVLGSAYGFLQGAWPFGLVEAVWAVIAARRWRTRTTNVHGQRPSPSSSPCRRRPACLSWAATRALIPGVALDLGMNSRPSWSSPRMGVAAIAA